MNSANQASELNDTFSNLTIGEIVRNDYRAAKVFEKYGIDFCCGGKNKLDNACNSKQLNIVQVTNDLKEATDIPLITSQNFNLWDIDFLADYIVRAHHKYVREAIPQLKAYLEKIVTAHSHNHPETIEIANLFNEVADELLEHMHKEEHVLFPYIKNLFTAYTKTHQSVHAAFGSVKNPILKMENDHERAGEILKKIDALSNHYTPPSGTCNTFHVCYHKLKEFEDDLHQHVHLENNILFPKSIEMESKLTLINN
jgi:regulator of cell morphogenesis and NO signaling